MNHLVTWSPGMKLDILEQAVILKAYSFYNKNKTTTSQALGISIRTLDSKLEKYEKLIFEEELALEARKQERAHQLKRARGDYSGTPPGPEARSTSRLESASQLSSKQAVPVHVGTEVQEMLPKQSAASGSRRGR